MSYKKSLTEGGGCDKGDSMSFSKQLSLSGFVHNPGPNIQSNNENAMQITRYGFLLDPSQPKSVKELNSDPNDEEFLTKWMKLMIAKDSAKKLSHQKKIKYLARKNVPLVYRGKIWKFIMNTEDRKSENPKLYKECLSKPIDTEIDKQIRKDITRTFPKNVFFSRSQVGRERLYNVLRAVSTHFPEVGYGQGMGFPAAVFLINVMEEDSFWLMVTLMESKSHLQDIYKCNSCLLDKHFVVFDKLLQYFLPKLSKHFKEVGISTLSLVSNWFITLFSNSAPFSFVLRVFDVFLSEGFHAIYQISLAIFSNLKKVLIGKGMKEIFDEIKKFMSRLDRDPDILLDYSFRRFKITHKFVEKIDALFELND